jgi:uncharacterized protein (TIGR04222 family)
MPPVRVRRPWRAGPALGVTLCLAAGLAWTRGAAAEGGERILSHRIAIDIGTDGLLRVRETIAYDFGPTARHGIVRTIPERFRYDGRYDRVEPIEVLSVSAGEGTPSQYRVERAGADVRIRVGDPDRTVTGRHTYVITYRVAGALNGFADHDELYWNATGNDTAVPVDRAEVEVRAPAPITAVACFRGPRGSNLPCAESAFTGTTATFSDAGLAPFEGVTVVVGFPPGAVPTPRPILEERWSLDRAFARTPATVTGAAVLTLAVIAGLVALGWRHGRDRRWAGSPVDAAFGNTSGTEVPVGLLERTETPVEFAPPDGLRPGQIGTLVDEVANPLDVTATIVDLAVRGHLTITEIPKTGWFGKPDWVLTMRTADGEMARYERMLYDALFESGRRPEVKLSELRDTFASELRRVQNALYAEAVERGWFSRRPDRVRTAWGVAGVFALIASVVAVVLAAAYTHAALVTLPLVIGAVGLLVLAPRMPRRTAEGTAVLRRALGFRRLIAESEAERARFAERANLFSEYLPYAIVFGCTDKWAKAFAGLDGRPPDTSSWYRADRSFTVGSFSDAMDSFATTTAGTISSTPGTSGSSGFGGGSSGGGGGGGGTGSW